jgi:hypothetical protein
VGQIQFPCFDLGMVENVVQDFHRIRQHNAVLKAPLSRVELRMTKEIKQTEDRSSASDLVTHGRKN